MTDQANGMIRSLYAIRAILALERGALLQKHHESVVYEAEFFDMRVREFFLQVMLNSVVSNYQPSTAFLEFEISGDPDVSLVVAIGGTTASTQTVNTDLQAALDLVVTDLNTWLDANSYFARAYRVEDMIKVVGDIDNDTTFTATIGAPAGTGTLTEKSQQDFEGRYEVGCLRSHCDDGMENLEWVYRTLADAAQQSDCCKDSFDVQGLLNDCEEATGTEIAVTLTESGGTFIPAVTVGDPLSLDQFTWEFNLYSVSNDVETLITGYPLTGTQADLPAFFNPFGAPPPAASHPTGDALNVLYFEDNNYQYYSMYFGSTSEWKVNRYDRTGEDLTLTVASRFNNAAVLTQPLTLVDVQALTYG